MDNMQENTQSIPPALLAEIVAAAEEEHRSVGDILRDVIERGLEERRWQRLLAFGAKLAKHLGLTEADVPRLIAESRLERREEQAGA
jgi:ABC-type lipoprotein release transport system permease subunit